MSSWFLSPTSALSPPEGLSHQHVFSFVGFPLSESFLCCSSGFAFQAIPGRCAHFRLGVISFGNGAQILRIPLSGASGSSKYYVLQRRSPVHRSSGPQILTSTIWGLWKHQILRFAASQRRSPQFRASDTTNSTLWGLRKLQILRLAASQRRSP